MGYEVDFLPAGEGEKSGDAIALRFGNLHGNRKDQTVVVIDGGFKGSGEQLVNHIKTYYHTDHVDLVISTHPDADHAAGLEVVLEELSVGCLWMHQPWKHTDDVAKMFRDGRVTDASVSAAVRKSLDEARGLERLAQAKRIPIIEPFAGVVDNSGCLFVLGPTQSFYESLLPYFRGTPEPKELVELIEKALREAKEFVQRVAENWNYETLDDSGVTTAENNSSVILMAALDGNCLLFTGDAGIPALTEAADLLEALKFDFSKLGFIQVPHHGSKRNVGPTILDRLVGPRLMTEMEIKTAFASVSPDGNPKHPSKKVTNAFKRRGAPVCLTKGRPICYFQGTLPREGWTPLTPLPFYYEVEE